MSSTPRVRTQVFGVDEGFMGSFRALYGEFWSRGVLDEPAKEIARLRNARITDCGF